jgi:hypothetical protein
LTHRGLQDRRPRSLHAYLVDTYVSPADRAVVSSWRHAWPGPLATVNGVRLSRFAYIRLVPFPVAAGVVAETGAGYLNGAVPPPVAARDRQGRSIRAAFARSVLTLAACAWPRRVLVVMGLWRFIVGMTGAVRRRAFSCGDAARRARSQRRRHLYRRRHGHHLSSLLVPTLAGTSIARGLADPRRPRVALTPIATWPLARRHGRRSQRQSAAH